MVRHGKTSSDRSLNVAIRGLPESDKGNLNSKVNLVMKDGPDQKRVSEINCAKNIGIPINLVSKLLPSETGHKHKVMKEKSNLKNNRQYRDDYINQDQSREQRLMTCNFKAVLAALNRNEKDLSLCGARIVPPKPGGASKQADNGIRSYASRAECFSVGETSMTKRRMLERTVVAAMVTVVPRRDVEMTGVRTVAGVAVVASGNVTLVRPALGFGMTESGISIKILIIIK